MIQNTIKTTNVPEFKTMDTGDTRGEEAGGGLDSFAGEYDLSRALDTEEAASVRRSLSIASSTAVCNGEPSFRV